MHAIKAQFDGKRIKLPKKLRKVAPGEVLVIFDDAASTKKERASWLGVQEAVFAKVWDNDEGAIYDTL